MTKLILTASILSLLTVPAFAAEEGFFAKLEQGVKAEANTQLQGVVGASIKGTLPSSAQRIVKPAANELVRNAVEASSSAIKQDGTQKEDTKVFSQDPGQEESLSVTINGSTDALFVIPEPLVAPRFQRLCQSWGGSDCLQENRESLRRLFPEIRDRTAAQAGVSAVQQEREAWIAVYTPATGELDFSRADEVQMRRLKNTVLRSNELVEKGIIHPDTLYFRKCIKRKVPSYINGKAMSKAEVCA